MSESIFPVYEFRPLPSELSGYGELLRYSDGEFIPDDGEYGLAFAKGTTVICVGIPYQKNIIWRWFSRHWSSFERGHPSGNAWHYMLREGEKDWGGVWKGRDKHPNIEAGNKAMSLIAGKHRCANGRHVEFDLREPHIKAGLLRERDSEKAVEFPVTPCCMYCGDDGGSILQADAEMPG